MRTRIAVIVGTCLAAQLVVASTTTAAGARIRAREVVGGLNQPVAFTFGPGRKVWYVEKETGQVRIHDLDTDADRLFVTVGGVNGDGERGMLGIALHPSYPAKPLVYVYATRSAGGRLSNQILRYRDRHGSGVNRTVLFTSVAGGSPYHNGGRIAFGPDGMLYAIVGDAHDSSNAQDTTNED
ncbi:MAG TPA: PQQ-dependent sugar dehydrogenase, partial [Actinomycetota bacterium]